MTSVELPVGIPESFEEHVTLMCDLLAVAYQADDTGRHVHDRPRLERPRMPRSSASTSSTIRCRTNGNDEEHRPGGQDQRTGTPFGKFLAKLQATPDGDESLLDHSLIFYGGGMGNPNQHASDPLPMVAVGGAWKVPACPTRAAHAVGNLWLTVAQKYDSPIARIGESTTARSISSEGPDDAPDNSR